MQNITTDYSKSQGNWLLLCALLQGLGLLLLHQAFSFDWPIASSPSLLLACYAVLLTGPSILIYGVNQDSHRVFYNIVITFTLIAALLGVYVGSQTLHPKYPDLALHGMGFAAVMSLLTFKVFIFASSIHLQDHQWQICYSRLISNTCRLLITVTLASIFTLLVWLIVVLWAELFNKINITLFKDIFYEPWFIYPTLSLAHAIGVLKIRRSNKVVSTANQLIQTLSFALLPLLLLLNSVFLVAIAYVGLTALWDNGGSNLVFVLTALILVTLNLAFQDSKQAPKMHRIAYLLILAGIAILPIYLAISGYGLWLRVEQYGLSISRLWAIFMWVFLTLYLTCYSISIITNARNWLDSLATINTRLGLLLIVALFISQSPILNFKQLSAQNQLARIHAGITPVDDIDVYYFAHELGVAGRDVLKEIDAHFTEQHPQLGARIEAALNSLTQSESNAESTQTTVANLINALEVRGETPKTALEPALISALQNYANTNSSAIANSSRLILLPVELTGDKQSEYLLIMKRPNYFELPLFYLDEGKWLTKSMYFNYTKQGSDKELVEALLAGEYQITPAKFKDIQINGTSLKVSQY
ncbi:DUF4153 domain-containing protein [Pseudoalteromonas sp. MMG022]|uniref:DUF4153 domain-containing protein n=1 Tax=Pseudoalteromonas sp. MMG022 TaxID=2909978 RepID=UPI001F28CB74|nr:DUF4153 domain-containing protein [Pseudoalteromonas sp. MMG022]MCF6437240.1 DUF4153 domain-containing protein [Pseudoalteromonas sp. MMG022]